MPSVTFRHLPESLTKRLRAYREAHGLDTSAAGVRLLTFALDTLDARKAGARAINAAPPATRTARAKKAIAARWAKAKGRKV